MKCWSGCTPTGVVPKAKLLVPSNALYTSAIISSVALLLLLVTAKTPTPPKYTWSSLYGLTSIVLSYQPCPPRKSTALPLKLTGNKLQLLPPFSVTYKSEPVPDCVPNAEPYTLLGLELETASSIRPFRLRPVLTLDQLRPALVVLTTPILSIEAYCVLKSLGAAIICCTALVVLWTLAQDVPPSVDLMIAPWLSLPPPRCLRPAVLASKISSSVGSTIIRLTLIKSFVTVLGSKSQVTPLSVDL